MNRSVDIIRNSVAVLLPPGSCADMNALYDFCFPVDARSVISGDRAYNAHAIEDALLKYDSFVEDGIKIIREGIESVFSVIKQRFPAHIHAVAAQGFELKIFLFILTYGIEKAMM